MNKQEIDFKKCVSISTQNEQISMAGFWKTPEVEGEMNSGYVIGFLDINGNKWISECLDADHVYRELEAKGVDEKLINFILNYC
jgi:hypothetical protein